MTDYRVALDIYNGPLDLLLFLIRRDEIDIYDIPIARITQQYLHYVDLLNQLDPEIVSEFLVLAATLMEIKSRMLLPHPPQEQMDEEIVDPRLELVRQLLEYKTYKDAARSLEEAAAERALRHERRPTLPEGDTDEIAIEKVPVYLRTKGRGIRPGRNELESVNRPVSIGGVQVCPGDVVVADSDGVIVVPRAVAKEVAEQARKILELDKAVRRSLYKSLGIPVDKTVE